MRSAQMLQQLRFVLFRYGVGIFLLGDSSRLQLLQQQLDLLNPYPRPRGFVFKARTWEDYARWRREQANPRLW